MTFADPSGHRKPEIALLNRSKELTLPIIPPFLHDLLLLLGVAWSLSNEHGSNVFQYLTHLTTLKEKLEYGPGIICNACKRGH